MGIELRQNGWEGKYENFRLYIDGTEVGEVEFIYRDDGRVGVYSVEIWEQHRRKGYGRILMGKVLEHLAGREAYLYVWWSNLVAIRLYQAHGFVSDEPIPKWTPGHNPEAFKVWMRRPGKAAAKAA